MASDDDNFTAPDGNKYPQSPGFFDSVKEGFLPMDQRAQIDAIRRIRGNKKDIPTPSYTTANLPGQS